MTILPQMHVNEIHTSTQLVAHLLASQFPQWAHLPIQPVLSSGTDNALYRLGDDMVVKLPRIDWAVGQIHKEQQWLSKLAPHLPLRIPTQLAVGNPTPTYPYPWAIYDWLVGENQTQDTLAEPAQTAVTLANFILALQNIDRPHNPPTSDRGQPLALRDRATRQAIQQLEGMFDAETLTAVWQTALQAPIWHKEPVWYHGDLLTGNLLFKGGTLHAIIDFATLGVGDPACDLMIAWQLFTNKSRQLFRQTLGVEDATWNRGCGWALSQAVIFIPYYQNTNPIGVQYAQQTLKQILLAQ